MWIVRLALRRPYTFVVMSLLITLLGGVAINSMAVDIFPYIDIPVLSILFQYNGPLAGRNVQPGRHRVRALHHLNGQRYRTYRIAIPIAESALYALFFQPGARIELAQAQVTASAQTLLKTMPPGMYPPNIIKYDASSVPRPAAWSQQFHSQRAGNLRLRAELHPHPSRYYPGNHHPFAVWRQIPTGDGGS